jgi:hypothetical protein
LSVDADLCTKQAILAAQCSLQNARHLKSALPAQGEAKYMPLRKNLKALYHRGFNLVFLKNAPFMCVPGLSDSCWCVVASFGSLK